MAKWVEEEVLININEQPDPVAFAKPADYYKRPRKGIRRPGDEPSISITSLMDALTIILVFLLKSYSANPVQLKQDKNLKPPFSTTEVNPSESSAIAITSTHILVDDQSAVLLENGAVEEKDLADGGLRIIPLYDKLMEEVEYQKKLAAVNKKIEFKGICTIIADRQAKYKLLSQMMYTAGQAGYQEYKFAAIKKNQ